MTDPQAPPFPIHAAGRDRDATGAEHSAAADERTRFVLELFERYQASLMRYLSGLLSRRADAEDIVQETCARLLRLSHLDRTGSRARAYMFKVATNLAYDRFRTRPIESFECAGQEADVANADQQPECIVSFEQGLDIVKRTLLELKPRCRQVFLLRASEELGYEAIAERLGVSKRTVEREMKHALEIFQSRLKRWQ